MKEKGEISLLVVEDEQLVRKAFIAMLGQTHFLKIVGEASSYTEAVHKTDLLLPDVVLMDIGLEEGSGIDACREIKRKHPSVKVIMLTAYRDEEIVVSAVASGAGGYILKNTHPEDLIRAIEVVYQGGFLLDGTVGQIIVDTLKNRSYQGEGASHLTKQEKRVITLISEGKTNKEIGETLHLSVKTIKNYVSNILNKMDMKRRSELASFATRINFSKNSL